MAETATSMLCLCFTTSFKRAGCISERVGRWKDHSGPSEQAAWERAKTTQMYLLFISLQRFKKEMLSLYYNAFLLGVRLEWGQSVQSLSSADSL